MYDLNELKQQAATALQTSADDLQTYEWEETFSNSAGPKTGPIPKMGEKIDPGRLMFSAQVLTDFTVHAFRARGADSGIKHCAGVWHKWSGEPKESWHNSQPFDFESKEPQFKSGF